MRTGTCKFVALIAATLSLLLDHVLPVFLFFYFSVFGLLKCALVFADLNLELRRSYFCQFIDK